MAPKARNGSYEKHKKEKYLNKIYYTAEEPGSFSGAKKIHDAAKKKGHNIKIRDVKKWITSQPSQGLFKQPKSKFLRSRIISPRPNYMFDADLMNMYALSKFNRNFKYVLLCIDIFSRMDCTYKIKVL